MLFVRLLFYSIFIINSKFGYENFRVNFGKLPIFIGIDSKEVKNFKVVCVYNSNLIIYEVVQKFVYIVISQEKILVSYNENIFLTFALFPKNYVSSHSLKVD